MWAQLNLNRYLSQHRTVIHHHNAAKKDVTLTQYFVQTMFNFVLLNYLHA